MAKVHNNIFVRGLTGSVGEQFVIRKTRSGKTIIANKPAFDENRVFTPAQMAQQEAFRRAANYAKTAMNQAVYQQKAAQSDMSAYNAAMADWFNEPEVLDIDASGWTGQVGQTIRIRAQDDTQVTRVHLVIDNGQGTIYEQSEMAKADNLWWTYTTTTQVPMDPAPRLTATAYDLPGNSNGKVF